MSGALTMLFTRTVFGHVVVVMLAMLLTACGRTGGGDSSLLDDTGTGPIFSRSCSYRTGIQGTAVQAQIQYQCAASYRANSRLSVVFALAPQSWTPANLRPHRELAELAYRYDYEGRALYEGTTESGRMQIRLGIPLEGSAVDFALVMMPGPQPYRADFSDTPATTANPPTEPVVTPSPGNTGAPATGDLCNGPAQITPGAYKLPFESERMVFIAQGAGGSFSHQNYRDLATGCTVVNYAFDFPVPEGTTITAARAGVVTQFRSSSNAGGPSPGFAPHANFIKIKHDDGTIGIYAHLKWMGVAVAFNQRVEAGEVIGEAGSTGFSTGPHLHFEVRTADERYPVPVLFQSRENPAGVVPPVNVFMTAE